MRRTTNTFHPLTQQESARCEGYARYQVWDRDHGIAGIAIQPLLVPRNFHASLYDLKDTLLRMRTINLEVLTSSRAIIHKDYETDSIYGPFKRLVESSSCPTCQQSACPVQKQIQYRLVNWIGWGLSAQPGWKADEISETTIPPKISVFSPSMAGHVPFGGSISVN